MKLYVAGGIFNEADKAQRKKEGEILRSKFKELDIFNPIDMPFNTNKEKLPTPEEIYDGDTNAVKNADIFIADLTNEDPGVMVELGIAICTNTKLIIGINSDIRIKSANKYDIPTYGMNHYVLGAILRHGVFVNSFDEAISCIEEFILRNK